MAQDKSLISNGFYSCWLRNPFHTLINRIKKHNHGLIKEVGATYSGEIGYVCVFVLVWENTMSQHVNNFCANKNYLREAVRTKEISDKNKDYLLFNEADIFILKGMWMYEVEE